MHDVEQTIMNIIAYSGEAKNLVYSALDLAQNDDKEGALKLIGEAKEKLQEVHKIHSTLLASDFLDALDNKYFFLLIHAEDIFMSSMSECELVSRLLNNPKKGGLT